MFGILSEKHVILRIYKFQTVFLVQVGGGGGIPFLGKDPAILMHVRLIRSSCVTALSGAIRRVLMFTFRQYIMLCTCGLLFDNLQINKTEVRLCRSTCKCSSGLIQIVRDYVCIVCGKLYLYIN